MFYVIGDKFIVSYSTLVTLDFIWYHILHRCNIFPLDLYFNTSGNVFPMNFLIVYSSFYYTLIIQSFSNNHLCGIFFTLVIVRFVHYGSCWQFGIHVLWITERNELTHMVSVSVSFFSVIHKTCIPNCQQLP